MSKTTATVPTSTVIPPTGHSRTQRKTRQFDETAIARPETTEAPAGPAADLLALVAEYDAVLVVGDYPEGFHGFGAHINGRITIVLPKDQDEFFSLDLVRRELARLEAAAGRTLAVADTPCETPWCQETESHTWCYGSEIGLPAAGKPAQDVAMLAYLQRERRSGQTWINYSLLDNADETRFRSGDGLRAETARVRAHLARLDALADQYDAITETDGTASPAAAPDGHFPWCAPGACQTRTGSDGTAWTEHLGIRTAVPNRGAMAYHKGDLVDAVLAADPDFPDPALHVTWRGEGAPYTADEARALVADLEAFVTGLKAQIAHLDVTTGQGDQR